MTALFLEYLSNDKLDLNVLKKNKNRWAIEIVLYIAKMTV